MRTRREFLGDIGKSSVGLAVSSSLGYSLKSYADSDQFVFKKNSLTPMEVYQGDISEPTSNLYFIDLLKIIKATPPYEPIASGKIEDVGRKGINPKYDIAFSESENRANTWLRDYFRGNDVIIQKPIVQRRNYGKDDLFESVPSNYESMNLEEIMNDLDSTDAVINYYKK